MHFNTIGFDNEQMIETVNLVLTNPSAVPTDEDFTLPFFGLEKGLEAAAFAKHENGFVYTWKCEGVKNWLVAGLADVTDCVGYVVLTENRGEYLDVGDDDDENIRPLSFKMFIPKNDVIAEYGYVDHAEVVELLRKHKSDPNAIQFIADMLE